MAMNNSNYRHGFSSPGYTSPYSSTPTGSRPQRPRFGYSRPSFYPRPRSSASKPNPDSLSMINNYGSSPSEMDTFDMSYNSENGNDYDDSYYSSGSSKYYSANDTFTQPSFRNDSYTQPPYGSDSFTQPPFRSEAGLLRNTSGIYDDSSSCTRPLLNNNGQNKNILRIPTSHFNTANYTSNSAIGLSSAGEFKGSLQKSNISRFRSNNTAPSKRKFFRAKKMASKNSAWKCELCSLDFTSQIPYDMHLRGARHAKKLKAKQALSAVKCQVDNKSVKSNEDGKAFFCELCNVQANSSLQLQTHLEGTKHKSKLQPKDPEGVKKQNEASEVNGKSNGSLVRSLPSDFEEPQPTKLVKFACDVCGISVNSQVQLEQHLSSKKHQNKVEGKPITKGKKPKMVMPTTETETEEITEATNEASTKVVGVKTLASSFVQGETLE